MRKDVLPAIGGPSARRWLAPLLLALSASGALAHVGPGAHASLFYAAPPGPQRIPPGGFWSVEFSPEPGAEMVLGLAKATPEAEVDLLLMNRTGFEAYLAAVEAGGGPLSYDHLRSVLFVSRRDDFWTAPDSGPYALVVDNTPLPAGGGRGRVEAVVFVALGSTSPLRQAAAGTDGGPWGGAALAGLAAAAGAGVAWRVARRRSAPRRGRGRSQG